MADFNFYVNDFFGSLIESEQEFLKLKKKAIKYLKKISGDAFDETDTDGSDSDCSDAICAVCDIYKRYEDRMGIASESADGYSVNYENKLNSDLYSAAKLHLPMRLLFRGMTM